jgi:hypothetical protein
LSRFLGNSPISLLTRGGHRLILSDDLFSASVKRLTCVKTQRRSLSGEVPVHPSVRARLRPSISLRVAHYWSFGQATAQSLNRVLDSQADLRTRRLPFKHFRSTLLSPALTRPERRFNDQRSSSLKAHHLDSSPDLSRAQTGCLPACVRVRARADEVSRAKTRRVHH